MYENSGVISQEFVVTRGPEPDNTANAAPVHSLFPARVDAATCTLKGFGRRTLISHICVGFSDPGHKLYQTVEPIDTTSKHRAGPFLSRS